MSAVSPFEGLRISRELVCEFFATFARFEFSLKELGCVRMENGTVQPAWWQYADRVVSTFEFQAGDTVADAIAYLCAEPPMIQVGAQDWQAKALRGSTEFAKALDAATRVRNNLFHGGKHTPHSEHDRDERLVRAALEVL